MRKSFVILLLVLFAVILIVLLPFRSRKIIERFSIAEVEISELAGALEQYNAQVQKYPTGNSVQILRTLRGDNPDKITLFEMNNSRLNAMGEFLDPWSTPYKIEMISETNFVVQSAGMNQKFDDHDDYIFDSIKRSFIQKPKP